MVNDELIYDIGSSEGNDTAFYLDKGFRVVSVEADQRMYANICDRFSDAIASGKLFSYNAAAHFSAGQEITFWQNTTDQGVSSLKKSGKEKYQSSQNSITVKTINWKALVAVHGVPYFAKLVIEGGEVDFLRGIHSGENLPKYFSAECKSETVIDELNRIGYRKFKLVDQKTIRDFKEPSPAREGLTVGRNNTDHGSGLFGKDLPEGRWLSYEEVVGCLRSVRCLIDSGVYRPSWFDCHAEA